MASLKGSCHGHLVARFRFLIWKLSPLWSEEEGLGSSQGQSSGHAGAKETVQKDRAVVTGVGTGLVTHRADRLEEPPGPLLLPTYWWNKFSSSSAAGWGSTDSCHLLLISTVLLLSPRDHRCSGPCGQHPHPAALGRHRGPTNSPHRGEHWATATFALGGASRAGVRHRAGVRQSRG